jgi:hypothetical protein
MYFLFICAVTFQRYSIAQIVTIRIDTFSGSFCFSAPPNFLTIYTYIDPPPPPSYAIAIGGDNFPCEGKVVGLFMGWALKRSRQAIVVCRYEEDPARGAFHCGESYLTIL